MNKNRVKIRLTTWNSSCHDGCCSDSGVTVSVDDVIVTEYGNQEHILISSILNYLGVDVDISEYNGEGEEIWQYSSFSETHTNSVDSLA